MLSASVNTVGHPQRDLNVQQAACCWPDASVPDVCSVVVRSEKPCYTGMFDVHPFMC